MTSTGLWKLTWLPLALILAITITIPSVTAGRGARKQDGREESLSLLVAALGTVEDSGTLTALLQGTLKGLEGQRGVPAPPQWAAVSQRLQDHPNPEIRELVSQLSQIFGDEAAVQRALGIVRDTFAPPDERRRQLTLLLDQQNTEASGLLAQLLDVPELQLTAIRGFAAVENRQAAPLLLQRYPAAAADLRRAMIETLATRPSYADALLRAVEEGVVSRDDIPTHVARSLHTLLPDRFVRVFGEPPTLSGDREQQLAQWKQRITPAVLEQADAARGRAVFNKTCAACHQLYGEGGKIGPDLTGSNRANLDYLLLNSIDPSYDVPAAYRMTTIVTTDGRVVNGVVAEEDGNRVVLKTVEKPRLVIALSDIDERVISKKSMMPDGQLDALKPQQVFDLVRYLRTKEQVELVK